MRAKPLENRRRDLLTMGRDDMPRVTIYEARGKEIVQEASAGTKLIRIIDPAHLETPCGGGGRCGKCRVRVQGQVSPPCEQERLLLGEKELCAGLRLACLAAAEGDCTVWLPDHKTVQSIQGDGVMPTFAMNPIFSRYGAAVDIGTTTLAARLYAPDGTLLAQATAANPQRAYGADVISRIERSMAGDREALAQCIRMGIDDLLRKMSQRSGAPCQSIDAVVLTGNTTMLYLLTGQKVDCLSRAPFQADELFGRFAESEELTLAAAPEAQLYLPRCVSAFVGADITCALLASQICESRESALLADIGTNGELALWHEEKLLCCSTAAGPVFEGAAISQGMQAALGAIDHVAWENGAVRCHTIGDAPAVGICGSGIIDAAAVLCRQGIIDETGAFSNEEEAYPLTDGVSLTQKDVRMIQLAKSALCAGMRTLMAEGGVREGELNRLVIAGGFGSYLDLHSAAAMGLYPAELEGRAAAIGNAALAARAETVDLSTNPIFMENYVECMSF